MLGAARRDAAQHDVRKLRLHGAHGALAGVHAGHVPEKDPRLSFLPWVHHVVQCGRELQDRGRRYPAVLQPGLLWQDGVCLETLHERVAHMWDPLVRVSSWVKIVRKLHTC